MKQGIEEIVLEGMGMNKKFMLLSFRIIKYIYIYIYIHKVCKYIKSSKALYFFRQIFEIHSKHPIIYNIINNNDGKHRIIIKE